MPGRDGTGPIGRGSMTGGGFGNCSGRGTFGPGAGRGMRRIFQRRGFAAGAPDPATENRILAKQNETLRSELDAIMKRLDEMEARMAGNS